MISADINDLYFVYKEIKDDLKAGWKVFGLSLGIRFPDLEALQDKQGFYLFVVVHRQYCSYVVCRSAGASLEFVVEKTV